MSEEIRQYLYDVYALPHETVKGTVNGIDTDRFRPRTPDADDFRAFGRDIVRALKEFLGSSPGD